MLFECGALFLREYAGLCLCGGVRASELYAVRGVLITTRGSSGLISSALSDARGGFSGQWMVVLPFEC